MRICTLTRTTPYYCTKSQPRQQIGASTTQSDKSKLYLVGRGDYRREHELRAGTIAPRAGSRLTLCARRSYYCCARWSILSPAVGGCKKTHTKDKQQRHAGRDMIENCVPVMRKLPQRRHQADTPAPLRMRPGAAQTTWRKVRNLPCRVTTEESEI